MSASRPKLALRVIVALSLSSAALGTTSATQAAPPAQSNAPCEKILSGPQKAQEVRSKNPSTFARAGNVNGKSKAEWSKMADDGTLWLDQCGYAFFVEPTRQQTAEAATLDTPVTAVKPLSETFLLESKPGSSRTIYLDFTGEEVSGTAWNANYSGGATMSIPAYSQDADTSNFSNAELTEIQRTWQIVAEDYAPFDVNVTTRDLGVSAIDRVSSSDLNYGTRVLFSTADAIYSSCSCGGIAYVNVFNTSGSNHMYYQPAWVFTKGVGTGSKNMAEAASHETGHNFGLNHDGTATQGYYSGAAPWAPIMGVGYSQPVSQWSRGEYAGANNTQDDFAVIATGAPLRTDDHGSGVSNASALANGDVINGVIGSALDKDVYRFTAAGATTVEVTSAPFMGNLDAELTILDSAGNVVTVVNPAVARVSSSSASGLGATWTTELPGGGDTYYAVVDGAGTGDPLTAGKYSDYGSVGNYQIRLSTGSVSVAPVVVNAQTLPAGEAGKPYIAQLAATGGDGTYTWTASNVPAGLTVSASGVVSGTPVAGQYSFTVTATSAGSTASNTANLTVNQAPPVTEPLAWSNPAQTLPSGALRSSYNATVSITGGAPGYTWARTGSLPSGISAALSSDQKSLVFKGTPKKRGTFNFTYTVTDSTGNRISKAFTIVVN